MTEVTIVSDGTLDAALRFYREDGAAALATVIETWGSAPRPVGSQMAISKSGRMAGSVSGGCVEGAVVAEASSVIDDGTHRILEFGVSDEEAFAVGLACGGRIRVLVEIISADSGITESMLGELVKDRSHRKQVAYCLNFSNGERRLVYGGDDRLGSIVDPRLASDRSGVDGDWFVAVHNPPLRMIIVGGVHIAQPLLKIARLTNYDPILVDPRTAFATVDRFPGESLFVDWPDELFPSLKPDIRTAVITLTHDAKIDDSALIAALNSNAFYIGSLGSVRTHAKRRVRLAQVGIDDAQIDRIHAPVGLDIGAKTPAEIAVAIMAEVTEALRRPR